MKKEYDYVIVGSGFGGSVSALRLAEKGYSVLVIEKGKRFEAKDFPKTNLNLKKWLWLPSMRFFGIFKLTFFKHVGIVSGVGVGGGSLVYANTLPVPQKAFFNSGSWAGLADWQNELEPFYRTAEKMLGAARVPIPGPADEALKEVAIKIGKEDEYAATNVSVFFGEPDKMVKDPYFSGKGPDRAGCNYCGACMTGCRYNAKNTLDKNYLYLAEQLGVDIMPEKEVFDVLPNDPEGKTGYVIHYKSATKTHKKKDKVKAKNIIFAGGVLGTVSLLLKLKEGSLPNLSERLGFDIRTNNESLIGVINDKNDKDFSKGVAIGSILHTDENSHLEVVRYGKGSSFWRLSFIPLAYGHTFGKRMKALFKNYFSKPWRYTKIALQWNFTTKNTILLFMQTLDSTIRFKRGGTGMVSTIQEGEKPTSFIPEAKKLAEVYGKVTDGESFILSTETILGIPTTAHILGGCVIGENAEKGVIDKNQKVFGYQNMMVVDGSAISANPGVNPSLSITAMSERAMSMVADKE